MNPLLVSAAERTAGVESGSRRRPVRSRVRNGSPSCADYGCTREVCKAAARRDRARRTSELRAGRRARIPASQAAAHARALREVGGRSAGDIAALSGISVTLVRRLLREPEGGPDIHRTTAHAILGVALAGAGTRHRHRLPGLVGTEKAIRASAEHFGARMAHEFSGPAPGNEHADRRRGPRPQTAPPHARTRPAHPHPVLAAGRKRPRRVRHSPASQPPSHLLGPPPGTAPLTAPPAGSAS